MKRTNNIISRTNESFDWLKSKAYDTKEKDETDCHVDTEDELHDEVKVEDIDDDNDASLIGARSESKDIPVLQKKLLLLQLSWKNMIIIHVFYLYFLIQFIFSIHMTVSFISFINNYFYFYFFFRLWRKQHQTQPHHHQSYLPLTISTWILKICIRVLRKEW